MAEDFLTFLEIGEKEKITGLIGENGHWKNREIGPRFNDIYRGS